MRGEIRREDVRERKGGSGRQSGVAVIMGGKERRKQRGTRENPKDKGTQHQRSQTKSPVFRDWLLLLCTYVLRGPSSPHRASRSISPTIHDPSDHAGLD